MCKFGLVYYDQDTDELFDDYLIPMLDSEKAKNLPKYNLAQLLGALVIPAGNLTYSISELKGTLY